MVVVHIPSIHNGVLCLAKRKHQTFYIICVPSIQYHLYGSHNTPECTKTMFSTIFKYKAIGLLFIKAIIASTYIIDLSQISLCTDANAKDIRKYVHTTTMFQNIPK